MQQQQTVAVATARDQAASPRERLVEAAYEMFSARGVRDVGIDEVIQRAGVAKATLYHHFPSKDDLVLAFLERREQRRALDCVETQARERGTTPEAQLRDIC